MSKEPKSLIGGQIEISKHQKTAVILGASGLVGSYCLKFLLEHEAYKTVLSIGRREIDIKHPKLRQRIVDFEKLENSRSLFNADDLFLCLGTTMAKAGSKDAFKSVDYGYNFKAAKIAALNGVNQCMLVSSVGAGSDSMFYYLRIKGKLEEDIKRLPFWSIHIFRPSLLLGERNENRFGEAMANKIGKGLDFVLRGMLMKYKPIEAEVVGKAMVSAAQGLNSGRFEYPSNRLQALADEYYSKK
jgi:uncharacterized protein YbjT (DUF2867 family)